MIYINRVTIPSLFDKQKRTSFERDPQIAQLIINHEFKNSGGRTVYVGEWHTHPEPDPSPSATDLVMINKQYTGNELNLDFVLMIIVGIKNIRVWAYNGKKLLKLVEI